MSKNKDVQVAARVITWQRDGKEMVYVPGGEFLMGSDEGKDN
jgi:formylglycine-generating enzyme required for sulfatase activity